MKESAKLPVTQTKTSETVIASQPIFTRILALTDFSLRSQAAVEYAVHLAKSMHARLTLLHILPQSSAFGYTMGGIEAAKKLAEETTRIKANYGEVDSTFRTGLDLHDEIISVAREIAADLLVVSTHGDSGWIHFLFGSDAAKIVRDAPCPILVVRQIGQNRIAKRYSGTAKRILDSING
jgi:nucleotide-binding universal stress UspA family protein